MERCGWLGHRERTWRRLAKELLLAEVGALQRLVAALPDRDMRTAEEILGYDAHGLPD